MTLQQTVSTILKKDVTLEFAMEFANTQFGLLASFLREKNHKIMEPKISNSFEERLNEIKTDCEMFQEIIIDKIDSLVNDISVTDFKKGSKLSFSKDRFNLFINQLNEN